MIYDYHVTSYWSIIHDDVIKWKHFPRNWPFVREIHRSPVNFPHKGQWRGALMFSLIYAWINDWVNNREAGDLRRQHGHYDVIVMNMFTSCQLFFQTINQGSISDIFRRQFEHVIMVSYDVSIGYYFNSYLIFPGCEKITNILHTPLWYACCWYVRVLIANSVTLVPYLESNWQEVGFGLVNGLVPNHSGQVNWRYMRYRPSIVVVSKTFFTRYFEHKHE